MLSNIKDNLSSCCIVLYICDIKIISNYKHMEEREFEFKGMVINGFVMISVILILTVVFIFTFFMKEELGIAAYVIGIVGIVFTFFLWPGIIQLEPNEARAMVFFGTYKGTFRRTGLFWINPFMTAKKLSLRARNLNVDPIKVNDKVGNPILIGLVLVWKLKDTYKALFEIDSQTMASKPNEVGTSFADHGQQAERGRYFVGRPDESIRRFRSCTERCGFTSGSRTLCLRQ